MILGLLAGGVLLRPRAGLVEGTLARAAGALGLVGRLGPGRAGPLPGRQTDLDPELGALQRRLVLPVPGRLLRGPRPPRHPLLGLPAAGHRHELDRRLLHGRRCSRVSSAKNLNIHLGKARFPDPRRAIRSLAPRSRPFSLVLWLILFWMYRRKLFLRI